MWPICRREGPRRVALPLLGAGVAGLPAAGAVAAMRAARWAAFPDLRIVLCAYTPADQAAVRAALGGPGSR